MRQQDVEPPRQLAIIDMLFLDDSDLVRASLRYAARKHWAPITKQLRHVYTAPTPAAAEAVFLEFCEEWEGVYPAMIRLWRNSWEQFIPFLDFPPSCGKSCIPPTRSRV